MTSLTIEDKIIALNAEENRRGIIYQMVSAMPQYNVVATKIEGRKIWTSDVHWVYDFASCNYLGLDLDADMQQGVLEQINDWGVHPSWCRLVASPAIYREAEEKIASLIGTETCLILPTVTLISIGVLPALVGRGGTLFLDKSGHETMYEAAKIARDNGSYLESFKQNDLQTLEQLLQKHKDRVRKVILIDGVYSMSGDIAELPSLVALAKKYEAIIYIDDAHGFGVIGEQPTPEMPFGFRGKGVVKHFGLSYENILYVGGCSKAYSSLAAFVGCSHKMRTFLTAFATPYDLSGPCPTASLATLLSALRVNEIRGDPYRKTLWDLTQKTIQGLRKLGYVVYNTSGFPIVYVKIGDQKKLIQTAEFLFQNGILVTVCPYPMVRLGEEGHRITLTAANTDREIDHLLQCFSMMLSQVMS